MPANKCFIEINDQAWEKTANKWLSRNKPKSACYVPGVIDIRDKVPLPVDACNKLSKKIDKIMNFKKFEIVLVDLMLPYATTLEDSQIMTIMDNTTSIERWIIEKDLNNER